MIPAPCLPHACPMPDTSAMYLPPPIPFLSKIPPHPPFSHLRACLQKGVPFPCLHTHSNCSSTARKYHLCSQTHFSLELHALGRDSIISGTCVFCVYSALPAFVAISEASVGCRHDLQQELFSDLAAGHRSDNQRRCQRTQRDAEAWFVLPHR